MPSYIDLSVEQRIVEAATLIPRGGGAVTGWAALRWLGGTWFGGGTRDDPAGLPVELAMCSDIRPRAGVSLCEERWSPVEVVVVDGLTITNPVRSAGFAARRAPHLREAVRVIAMAAYDDLVSVRELLAYAGPAPREGHLSSWTGVPQCRRALQLAHENAWSPQEVTMQLIWELDAGLPRPRLNQPVFDLHGRHIGTPDLLDVDAGLVCEYDSVLHLQGAQRARDVRREEAFRDAGLEYLTMLAGDAADPGSTAARMVRARERARRLPQAQRAWTIEQPTWWVATESVALRRSLTRDQRARLLRYRRAS